MGGARHAPRTVLQAAHHAAQAVRHALHAAGKIPDLVVEGGAPRRTGGRAEVAVADAILDQGHTYTFRLQPNATSMGVNGAQFLAELAENSGEEISSVVYLYEGTTGFGDSVRAAFVEEAANLGIEVLEEIGYAPFEVTDLTTERWFMALPKAPTTSRNS